MASPTLAFITPSYAGDLERCRLLCESLDLMARDDFRHYILVADHDLALFKPLATERRLVIPESELLPSWLKVMKRPFGGGRYLWASLRPMIWPMSGWHIQQLRKMLIARHIPEDVLIMVDSDSLFIRPFDSGIFHRDGAVRLYVKERGIDLTDRHEHHRAWLRNAADLLGLAEPALPAADYINNIVSWRRDHVLAMLNHIEKLKGRDIVSAIGRFRSFSEYQIYGAFVADVLAGAGHFRSPQALSHTYWSGDALTYETLSRFVQDLHPDQIAIGVQSFTDTPTDLLRHYLAGRAKAL